MTDITPLLVELEQLLAKATADWNTLARFPAASVEALITAYRAERMRADAAEAALSEIMELPGELNMANYDDDDVRKLNDSHIEAFQIARVALNPDRRAG